MGATLIWCARQFSLIYPGCMVGSVFWGFLEPSRPWMPAEPHILLETQLLWIGPGETSP